MRQFLLLALTTLACAESSLACHDGSPLILDLNGDGILTSHVFFEPVIFDIDADGNPDIVGWTNPHTSEGLLIIDLNRNGTVDNGGELFGDSSHLPTGEEFDNGFDALAVYDRSELGGDQDGRITHGDVVWRQLRIWMDQNHDGVSQRQEIRSLDAWKIESIGLNYHAVNQVDGNLNSTKFVGSFQKRLTKKHVLELQVADVFFKIRHHD